jgi:hypothetical protein
MTVGFGFLFGVMMFTSNESLRPKAADEDDNGFDDVDMSPHLCSLTPSFIGRPDAVRNSLPIISSPCSLTQTQ